MKRYKLLLLEKGQVMGEITVNNDFSHIKINLDDEHKDLYKKVLDKLISIIKEDGNFKASSDQLFWTALVQSLFLKMGILVDTRGV